MNPRDLLDRVAITAVWHALGGGPLRHARGKAFWRDGAGWNIAVSEAKGVWFDHVESTGGGVLALIETVLGCDHRAAVRWLADHLGIGLDDRQPLSPAERRAYAQRRGHAESKAQELTDWRRDTLWRLRDERNRLYLSENAVSAVARTLLAETGAYGTENAWACIWKRALDDQRGDEANRQIEAFEKATVRELIAMRQQWEGLAA